MNNFRECCVYRKASSSHTNEKLENIVMNLHVTLFSLFKWLDKPKNLSSCSRCEILYNASINNNSVKFPSSVFEPMNKLNREFGKENVPSLNSCHATKHMGPNSFIGSDDERSIQYCHCVAWDNSRDCFH